MLIHLKAPSVFNFLWKKKGKIKLCWFILFVNRSFESVIEPNVTQLLIIKPYCGTTADPYRAVCVNVCLFDAFIYLSFSWFWFFIRAFLLVFPKSKQRWAVWGLMMGIEGECCRKPRDDGSDSYRTSCNEDKNQRIFKKKAGRRGN